MQPSEPSATAGVETLACAVCRLPLVSASDVIVERAESLKGDAVYAYELDDVCKLPRVWTYSATNPANRRFDVIRVHAGVAERGSIECRGSRPSPEHSWFPPFVWNIAHCVRCDALLGWGFYEPLESAVPSSDSDASETDEPLTSRLKFVGLIITNCVPVLLSDLAAMPKTEDLRSMAATRRGYWTQRQLVMARLREHPDQYAASRIAMLIHSLDTVPEQWSEMMPGIMHAIRGLSRQEETDAAEGIRSTPHEGEEGSESDPTTEPLSGDDSAEHEH